MIIAIKYCLYTYLEAFHAKIYDRMNSWLTQCSFFIGSLVTHTIYDITWQFSLIQATLEIYSNYP